MPDTQLPRRVMTGITGLDTILNGGLLEGGIYLVVGPPGAGKTMLGNQICFNHVAAGGRAVFITLLSETSSQMFNHLQAMTFFDRSVLGNRLHYFSGYSALQEGNLDGLLKLIQHILTDQKPTLIVMDGILYIETLAESLIALKEFIQTVNAFMEAAKCTGLLLGPPSGGQPASAIATTVDGVIELGHRIVGSRTVRELQVVKFRGSRHLHGIHQFQISDTGITVHPRLDAALRPKSDFVPGELDKMLTGLPTLDQMLNGGLTSGSTTVLLGVPGIGKTLLGMTYLVGGARDNQPGLYFGFSETPSRLTTKTDRIGLEVSQHIADGRLELLWQPPLENILDVLGERLLAAVARRHVKRVFIDGIEGLRAAIENDVQLNRFLVVLTNELRMHGVTTIISVELHTLFGPILDLPIQNVSALSDNLILLRYIELHSRLHRVISILKIRDDSYDTAIRRFEITQQGIEIADTFESVEGLLTGIARPITIGESRATPQKPIVRPE